MVEIEISILKEGRREACEALIRALPDWFQIEPSILEISKEADHLEAFAARQEGHILGLLVLKSHSLKTAEIFFMGVQAVSHRQGIGRALLKAGEDHLLKDRVETLEVKTLGPSHPDPGYDRTRRFYMAMGFNPFEESNTIWGPENPCLIMVKKLE